jgi:lysophospholipase L1-like esterase
VKRILVFGDSFAFGVGVDRSHVFGSRLEQLLDASTAQRFEVINMAVSGYSTDQQYLLFRELGRTLDPDLVILVVCYNDFSGNSTDFIYLKYYKPYFSMDERGHLTLENREVPRLTRWQSVKLWFGQESRLWNSMRNRRSDVPAIRGLLDRFQVGVPKKSTDREVELTASIIRRFEREASERGASVLVTTTAGGGGVDEPDGSFRRRDLELAELLAREDIAYLDLWPVLIRARRESPEKHWDFPGNTHWNIDAHRVAAEAVYEHLSASGAL